MKYYVIIFICFILLPSCKDDDVGHSDGLPECIQLLTDPGPNQDTLLLTVQRMQVDNEFHYWLNSGELTWDGPEFIVNEQCDTVCSFSFGPWLPCREDYVDGEWEEVWIK